MEKTMRRSASEIIRNLETRIARLEKSAFDCSPSYTREISKLILQQGLAVDTVVDPSIMEDLEDHTPTTNIKYGGWFITTTKHGEYDDFAMSADVGSYVIFDGKTWTADIVWTGFEGYYGNDPEELALRRRARSYFNNINRKPFSYKATGNVSQDLKAIKSMMSRI